MKTYRIRSDTTFTDYFDLVVCATQRSMNAYIGKYSESHGMSIEHDARTAGLVQPTQIREFPALDDRRWYSSHYATMFVNEEQLCIEIVAHECLHLAMAHERFVYHFNMCYGDGDKDDIKDEERICYYHGRVVETVFKLLHKHGHFKKKKKRP
jgi:hypothetical protein